MYAIGIDVGGTFTDLLAIDPATNEVRLAKVPTTVDNQAIGRAVDSLLNYETVKYFNAEERESEYYAKVARRYAERFLEGLADAPAPVLPAWRAAFRTALRRDGRIGDFRVVASHQESLHSHDAISLLTEGETFAATSLDPRLFQTLIHAR